MTATVAPGVRDRLLTRLDELLALAEAALMVRVWTALRDEVQRHDPQPDRLWAATPRQVCEPCGRNFPVGADCPFVLRWADALGVTP